MAAAKEHRRGLLKMPLYPFLLGALPAVHFMEINFRLLQAQDLVRPLLFAVAISGIILLVGNTIWRNRWTTALVSAPLLAVLYKGQDLGAWPSLGLLVLSAGLGVKLRQRPSNWPRQFALPLDVALAILLFLPLVNVWRADRVEESPRPSAFFSAEIPLPDATSPQQLPDIYFLLVDGLGQPDYLEKRYQLTARDYTDPLASRGFQILRRSYANYPQTALSVAATLNLGTVDQVLDITDPASRDRRVLTRIIGNSRAVRALRRLGYHVADFPSGYPLTEQARADSRWSPFAAPSFVEYYLLEDGVLPLLLPLLGRGPADVSFALRRNHLDFIFDKLPEARRDLAQDTPLFTFAHILAPHPPFVYGPNGEPLASRASFAFADGDHWLGLHGPHEDTYRRLYADQARWIMIRLAETVDRIIASSPRPKVIIIQGDHGPGSGLKWEKPLATDHDERFGIYNAWYVWDGRQLPLYEGMTAMNTFPMLFDVFFGARLPRLPDDHWFARMSRPYTLYPVDN